jgi:hypothetical protein
MPIREFLHDPEAFDPGDLKAMGEAFNAALNRLGVREHERLAETVARRIISAVLAGERNVTNLTKIGAGERE